MVLCSHPRKDQVGGIEGGVKIARSPAVLPLHVTTTSIPLTLAQLDIFSSHLVLIYTGKTRLARNLLQNVVRNWYARHPTIVANVAALCENAEVCAAACAALDLPRIGHCLSQYWEQKKMMAPGTARALPPSALISISTNLLF